MLITPPTIVKTQKKMSNVKPTICVLSIKEEKTQIGWAIVKKDL